MAISNQTGRSKFLFKIAIALSISMVISLYAFWRWGTSLLLSGGIFAAGSLFFYFSVWIIYAFVRGQLSSKNEQKAYTIKSIVYLAAIWAIFFASVQSYWTFEVQHEISICPGWSNDVEETSYPILVDVTNCLRPMAFVVLARAHSSAGIKIVTNILQRQNHFSPDCYGDKPKD